MFFYMMVEGNKVHYVSMILYLGKILIWGLRALSVNYQVFSRKLVVKSF